MRKVYIIFPLVILIALSIPAHGGKDSITPGKYQDWNRTVDKLEIFQSFRISDYSKIAVLPLDTSPVFLPKIDDNTYEPVINVLSRITEVFIKGLKKGTEDKLDVALVEKEKENNPEISISSVLVIKAKVTEMNPGSWAKRFWIGFGAGKTRVEIEGDVLDVNTKTTLLKFKHARVSAMNIDDYERVLSNDAMDVCEDIGKMLLNF